MKIALAACSGMASDQPLARRLGDDYRTTISVTGAADRDNEVYPALSETLHIDLSGLSAERPSGCTPSCSAPSTRCAPWAHAEIRHRVSLEIDDNQSRRIRGPPVRLTAWVHGYVQGVGFRWWTRSRARELGLTGYAKNQNDGRVLVVAQGRAGTATGCSNCCAAPARRADRVDKVVWDWSGAPIR